MKSAKDRFYNKSNLFKRYHLENLWRHIFLEMSCFIIFFSEPIVINERWIWGNWRRFLFLRYKTTKTYLKFYTGVKDWKNHSRYFSLFFWLRKIQSESYYYIVDYEQLEGNFDKLKEVYFSNIFIYNNLFHFSYRCHIFGESNPSLSPIFQISGFSCFGTCF